MRVYAKILGVGLAAFAAVSQGLLAPTPVIPPSISHVSPPGARRGADVTLTIEGRSLAGVRALHFDSPGFDTKFLGVIDLPEESKPKNEGEDSTPRGRSGRPFWPR